VPLTDAQIDDLADHYDHHDPAFAQDAYRVYDAMRGKGRVVWSDRYGGFFAPTRFAEMRDAWTDWETFATRPSVNLPAHQGAERPMIPLEVDPPRHARYRKALAPMLAGAQLASLEPKARLHVNDLIDAVVDKGGCDFVASVSSPFPTRMFMELYGLPLEEADQFLAWNHGIIHSHTEDPSLETVKRCEEEVLARLAGLVAERRRGGGGGILGRLLVDQIDGELLSDEEITDMSFQMFLAGLDTTHSAMAWQIYFLSTHLDHQRSLREAPKTIPNAVEELLRWEGLLNVRRTATKDAEIGGVTVPKGCPVLLSARIANHDPEVFPDPELVDFERPNAHRHLAFGSGVHRCIGVGLARLELRVLHEEWHRRIPEYTLAPGAKIAAWGGNLAGIATEVPVRW